MADRRFAQLACRALLIDPLHHRTEIDIGEPLPLELRQQMPATTAPVIRRVAVRQSIKERLERRLELRSVLSIPTLPRAMRDSMSDTQRFASAFVGYREAL